MGDASEKRLIDGSPPATPEDLFSRLTELGIVFETVSHDPVFTVEEAQAVRHGSEQGGHIKNLFLRNKKGEMWLLVCSEDQKIDLKELGRRLGAGRLSFGSPTRLMEHLGVIPGAVTPVSIINDRQGKVRVVMERSLLQIEELNVHPLDNSMTTRLPTRGLVRFLEHEKHVPEYIDLS